MKKDEAIYIIGHRNPDTDAICSALSYADLKRKLGFNAQARRLGTLNEETKFVTRYFDVEAPLLMQDARTQLSDLDMDEPVCISENTVINDAWNEMQKTQTRTLYVVDDEKHLKGVVSTSNLASTRWFDTLKMQEFMKNATVPNLVYTLKGELLNDVENFTTNGRVLIITVINNPKAYCDLPGSICVCSDNEDMQLQLIHEGVSCLVISLGIYISDHVIEEAKKYNVLLIKSYLDSMQVAKVINESVTVHYVMTTDIVSYHQDDYVMDVISKVTQSRHRSYPVVNKDNQVVGSISRFHLFGYNKKKFILTDHSSRLQSIKYIDDGEILEIIDHHNIGDIETSKPIYYRNQKCGCTCTIIACLYRENNLKPDRQIAGCMMSAILSDTMNFKSQTTTQLDIDMCRWLADLAGIADIEAYAKEMLYASISIRSAAPLDILQRDLKMYHFGRFNIGVGQTNFGDIEDIQSRLEEYKEILDQQVENLKLDLLVMMFTHVTADGTMFVYSGELSYIMKDIIATSFDEHSGYDRQILSRKQQLIPSISSRIEMI